jgi:hypothetical protein
MAHGLHEVSNSWLLGPSQQRRQSSTPGMSLFCGVWLFDQVQQRHQSVYPEAMANDHQSWAQELMLVAPPRPSEQVGQCLS